ncbi:MAG: hypothetical protein HYU80_00255 [Candidatus Blackburnbacteria bacterium]|nr:hypothetical protein [Candidatus Blackburnbacteria bacterium]
MASKKANLLGKPMRSGVQNGTPRSKVPNGILWRVYSQVLISGALIAVILAGLGYLGSDIWLASTQWLIMAAVLAGFGVYAKLEGGVGFKKR